MKEMTSLERILRTYRHEETDRMPMIDDAWAGTVRRWKTEGMPEDADWREYFGFDRLVRFGTDNSPRFAEKTLEQTDRYRVRTTKWGMTQKVFNALDSTPETLDCYYCDREKWQEAKEKMLDDSHDDERIPWDLLRRDYDRWCAEGAFKQLLLWFGFDVAHTHMMGTETMLIALCEDPEWITDVFNTYLTSTLRLAQKVLDAGYRFDGAFWYDDLGYKGSTFFSPNTYRELLKPFHKRAADWAHERGMVVEMHSCGYVEPLIPDLVDLGVQMLNPLEVKAGMDPRRLKERFGDKLAFHGGINAQHWGEPELVLADMREYIPVLRQNGGYVFASDHSIPNCVSFETMKKIVALARELGNA